MASDLAIIFNKSMEEGSVPSDWKLANVTPISKKGKKGDPGNNWTASLTFVPCRVMLGFFNGLFDRAHFLVHLLLLITSVSIFLFVLLCSAVHSVKPLLELAGPHVELVVCHNAVLTGSVEPMVFVLIIKNLTMVGSSSGFVQAV